jgi:hypothetical protein
VTDLEFVGWVAVGVAYAALAAAYVWLVYRIQMRRCHRRYRWMRTVQGDQDPSTSPDNDTRTAARR